LPDVVLHRFQQLFKNHHLHILKLSGELARLSQLFTAHNIPWLSIKGPALSVQLYGDISARQSGDLDILVHEEAPDLAISILKQAGYEMITPIKGKHEENYRKHFKDCMLQHNEKKILVELHWALSYNWLTPDDITSLVWKDAENITIAHEKIPVPNIANHLIFLYEHGSRHSWYRLAWLWDITVARKSGLNKYIDTLKYSQELNLCFLTADVLCGNIFGIEVHLSTDKRINHLVHLSMKTIMIPEKTKSLPMRWLRLKYMLCLQSGVWRKIKCLKRYFNIPGLSTHV